MASVFATLQMPKRATVFVTGSTFHKFSCLQRDSAHHYYLRNEYPSPWNKDPWRYGTHYCTYVPMYLPSIIGCYSSLPFVYPHIFMTSPYMTKTRGSWPTRHQIML